MNLIDVFLITLYSHFCGMQERGRRIIPWLQTAFVVALTLTISIFLIGYLLLPNTIKLINHSEAIFIIVFFLTGCVLFVITKKYLFDTGRNIILSEIYLSKYSTQKRKLFKLIVIGICLLIPFLLGYLIWLNAKPIS